MKYLKSKATEINILIKHLYLKSLNLFNKTLNIKTHFGFNLIFLSLIGILYYINLIKPTIIIGSLYLTIYSLYLLIVYLLLKLIVPKVLNPKPINKEEIAFIKNKRLFMFKRYWKVHLLLIVFGIVFSNSLLWIVPAILLTVQWFYIKSVVKTFDDVNLIGWF